MCIVTCILNNKQIYLFCHLYFSYCEIYNEKVRDLLRDFDSEAKPLKVREHPKDGPYVQGLSKHSVFTYEAVEQFIQKGNDLR